MILEHRVSIFVFRQSRQGPEYLFVLRQPARESTWSPIFTRVRPEDTVRGAALRDMTSRWAAPLPEPWIDLNVCSHFLVGDRDLIDWCVGYGVAHAWEPSPGTERVAEVSWQPLPRAYQLLDSEDNRRALFRLHLEASSSGS